MTIGRLSGVIRRHTVSFQQAQAMHSTRRVLLRWLLFVSSTSIRSTSRACTPVASRMDASRGRALIAGFTRGSR